MQHLASARMLLSVALPISVALMCTVGGVRATTTTPLECSVAAHNDCNPNDAIAKRQKDLCSFVSSFGEQDPMDWHCDTKADIIFLIGLLGLGTVSAGFYTVAANPLRVKRDALYNFVATLQSACCL